MACDVRLLHAALACVRAYMWRTLVILLMWRVWEGRGRGGDEEDWLGVQV